MSGRQMRERAELLPIVYELLIGKRLNLKPRCKSEMIGNVIILIGIFPEKF